MAVFGVKMTYFGAILALFALPLFSQGDTTPPAHVEGVPLGETVEEPRKEEGQA